MSGHTPGPWTWDTVAKETGGIKWRTLDSPSASIVYHSAHWDVRLADRRLIAAAPELLAELAASDEIIRKLSLALIRLVSLADPVLEVDVRVPEREAAIAKAEGR